MRSARACERGERERCAESEERCGLREELGEETGEVRGWVSEEGGKVRGCEGRVRGEREKAPWLRVR